MADISIQDVRNKYPNYKDLSDQELADKLHTKFYADLPKEDFYKRIGFTGESIDKNNSPSFIDSLRNNIPKPSMPIGINVISGLMSLGGSSPQQKDIIRNLPQIASDEKTNTSQKIAQGIGEYLPISATGIGSVPGFLGTLGRVGLTSTYGAATNSQDRIAGAKEGAFMGLAGEAIPSALRGIGNVAEKINPIKFTKEKISNILENYNFSMKNQKESYDEAFKNLGDKKLIDDPLIKTGHHDAKEYLGFDKSDLSTDSQKSYDSFVSNPTIRNLHELQSQIYRDSISYKNNPNKIESYEKAKSIRNQLVTKVKKELSGDLDAISAYQKGSDITKNEIKPYLLTPNLRKIVSEKITELKPKSLESTIKRAIEKEKGNVPKNHYLRKILSEVTPNLETGKLTESIIPESLRKWSPNFVELSQNPTLVNAIKRINSLYNPIKYSLTGKSLEE